MRARNLLLFFLIAIAVSIAAGSTYSQAAIPAKLQAAIFMKVLSYDSNLKARSPSNVVIAIVTDAQTSGRKSDIQSGFEAIAGKSIQGKTVKITAIDFKSGDQLNKDVKAAGANILYVSKGAAEATINAVIGLANSNSVPVLCDAESLVRKGIAVGLTIESGKPKIVVNLKTAKQQGMKLSSKVLQLAKVIK